MNSYSSLSRLDDRQVVVIGAGNGLGRESALGLADFGAHVVCADVDGELAQESAHTIRDRGGKSDSCPVDVTDSASVRTLASAYAKASVVVCTPGINVRKEIQDYADEEFDRVIEVNLKGTFRVMREFGRAMAANGGGSIIAFSSIRSLTVEPGQAVYASTKAGIVQLARGLASELGPKGVRVNCVAPGVVDTPLTQTIKSNDAWRIAYEKKSALGRWARVDEIVGPVVYLASDASSYVTGSVLFVDGGWTAVDGRFTPPL